MRKISKNVESRKTVEDVLFDRCGIHTIKNGNLSLLSNTHKKAFYTLLLRFKNEA